MFNIEELKKAFEDKEFAEAYSKLTTVKEATEAFNSIGLECTEEEVEALLNAIKIMKSRGGELEDDELENVAGGGTVNRGMVFQIIKNPELYKYIALALFN